jgi:gliding motility-associated-like protein
MNLKKYSVLILAFLSLTTIAQTSYDSLSLPQKIAIKEGTYPFPGSNLKAAGGTPTPQTTGPEQQCNSAIPVCQNIYTTSTSYSGNGTTQEIPNNSCLGSNELNSVWYTFTSSTAGNIAFNITPNVLGQDYDFALYNITGTNCSAISSGALTPIRCNFSASGGVTGLSPSGTNASEPASGINQSTVLPTTPGQTYVLIISNYSSSANGYQLNFTPGTASIFDVTPPTLTSVSAPCGSNVLTLNTSEQVTCASIASNGSDLSVSGTGGPYTVTGASGVNCGASAAQITFTVSPSLSGAGPWTLNVHSGSDGNTLIDNCGNALATANIVFSISPATATITGPSTVCKGSTFALSVNSANSYTWSGAAVPGGQQNNQTISVTANTAGTLNFTCVLNFGACGTATVTKVVTVTDAPIANFTALPSLTVCAGTAVTFTNISTYPCSTGGLGLNQCTCGSFLCQATSNQGTFATYLWTFGDGGTAFYIAGTPASNFSPSHTYAAAGTYVVSLTASGLINTCSNSKNITITVLPAAPTITISPSVTICPSQSTTLTAQGAASYTWTPGATLNTTSGGTVVASPASTQIYTVTTPACVGTQANTVQVTVNGTPPAIGAISGPTAVCPNQTGVTYSVANVASTNYTWSVPAGASITSAPTNSNAITVSFGASVGTISVIAVGTCGTATASIVVGLSVAGTLTLSPSSTVCPAQSATLTANGGTTYTWTPAATLNTANGATVIATPASTQVYTVSSTSCGSPVTGTVQVTVNSTPPAIGSVNGLTTVCPNQTGVTYSVSNVASTNYTWTVPAGASITSVPTNSNAITVSFGATAGSITVIAASACGSATSIVVVNTSATPSLVMPANATVCPNSTVTLGVSGGSTYTWSPAGSLSSANGNTVTSTPTVTTIYTVTSLACGSPVTGTVEIVVSGAAPNLGVMQGLFILCPDQKTGQTYSVINVPGATYNWTTPPGSTITSTPTNSNSITINFGASTGSIIATATTACGSATSIATVAFPNSPTITVSPNTAICPTNSVTLSAGGAASFTWNPGGVVSQTISVSPSSTTIYTVTGFNNVCTNTNTVQVTANANPTITISPNATICPSASATLTASGATTYTWSNSGSLSSANGGTVTATPASTTTYVVTGSGVGGCQATNTVVVTLNTNPTIVAPASATICPGVSATLTASGANTYTWANAATLNTASGATVIANPIANTTYTITGASAAGCIGTATTSVVMGGTITVNVSPNFTVCPLTAHTFTANGVATSYTWTPNVFLNTNSGGTVISTPSITTTYTVDGASGACTGSNTVSIIVQNNVVVTASANTPTICPLRSATLTASGATSYVWSPVITLNSSTGSSVIATPPTSTTYTVIGSTGTCTNSALVVVTVTTTPVLTISTSPSICAGGLAALSVSGSNTYTWSPATGLNTTSGANVNANPNTTTTYSVNSTSLLGCTSSTIVSVNVTPIPSLTLTSNPSTICSGSTTALAAFGSSTGTYAWSPSASLSSATGANVTASPVNSTTYTVIGSNGINPVCSSSKTIAVNVLPIIIVKTATTQAVCLGNSVILEAHGGNTYQWSPSTGVTNVFDSITSAIPNASGIYTVTVSNNGLCPRTGVVQVTILPLPSVNAGKDSTINIDEEIVLVGTSNVPVGYFGFLPLPDGIPLNCNLCPKVTVHPLENTCYVIQAQDQFTGCKNWDTVCITITKDWNIYIPNAFTPNGDIDNEYFIPKGYGLAKINLAIFDRWGVQIFKENETKLGWDGSHKGKLCQEGVYIYQVEATSLGGNKFRKTGHVTLLSRVK